jgi:phosphoserine phosphatase
VAGGAEDLPGLRDDARQALSEAGAEILSERALSRTACETECHGDVDLIRSGMRAGLAGRAADWCLQSAPARPRRLLLCDMDSTIISCECVDEIGAILGIKSVIAEITAKSMRGEIDFEASLVERVALLEGVSLGALERVWAERVRLNPGAATLVATMKARGARTVLVSGGFTFFTERVAALAGFEHHHANRLVIEGGRLTGAVAAPIQGRRAKLEALLRHARELGVGADEAVAIGDGANDLEMIAAAGLGIAYRAKPVLEDKASARIATGDLRSALAFQGIAEGEFVERG